ncbi:hypothetical protein PRIPAC_92900, partial [Pristionchus pacificus]
EFQKMILQLWVLLLATFASVTSTPGCISRSYTDGTVCVCNSTYCDDIVPLGSIPLGYAAVYRSDINGARMDKANVQQKTKADGVIVELDPSTLYQEIIGFGAAFTDSSGYNIKSLPKDAQDLLLKQYFGPTGTEYNLGRVPMASTDFSTTQYSYDDVEGDLDLKNFSLAKEDFDYKIPLIKQAMSLQQSNGGVKFFAAPWAPPGWMKTNGKMEGGGYLLGEPDGPYYVTWANYFVKFFEAYLAEGIGFWAVTPQNEPNTGHHPNYAWQTLGFNASTESDFVRDHLGPTLKTSPASTDVIIIGMDDNRFLLPDWADVMFADPAVSSYVSGIAVHWYEDEIVNPNILSTTHDRHPEKFLLATEACNGWLDVQG